MTDRYIDPNSGAAPQPGGYSHDPNLLAQAQADEEHPAGNVTEPDEARQLSEEEANDPTANVEELSDEQIRSQSYDTEMQNQAAPQGEQPGVPDAEPVGPVGSYVGDPALATDEEGNPIGADGEPVINDGAPTATDADGQATDVAEEETTTTETTEGGSEEASTSEQPAGNASRDEWVAYAKSDAGGNKTDEELEGLGRNEIRDLYA